MLNSEIYKHDIENIINENLPWGLLSGSTVMIAGASGLIGTVLIDALMYRNEKFDDKINIYALGRNVERAGEIFKDYLDDDLFHFIRLDVNRPIEVNCDVDYIIHAASNTHPRLYANDPIGSLMTNLLETKNLLDYGRGHGLKRFVFLSSVEIYGNARKNTDVFDETYCGYLDCNTLRAAYPEGKRAAEALRQGYIEKYGLDIVIARLSRIYGPTMKMDDSKAMSQFIMNSVRHENIILKSKGLQRYSYTYVSDAVRGILYVMLKGSCGEAYNIAGDEVLRLKEIAQILASLSDSQVVFELPDKIEGKGFSKADTAVMCNKKTKQLGWKENNCMEKGLDKTINILRKH